MTPPPDKIRSWRVHPCVTPGCDFKAAGEWEWLRHLDENPGHCIDMTGRGEPLANASERNHERQEGS